MVKQNYIEMKQPLLGQKILEWRKAKGLTQEELVERCNINVRTIQRIEAGEVTPRSYTVKAILEVLEVKVDEIEKMLLEKEEIHATDNFNSWMKFSFIAGIVYLVAAIVEVILDAYLIMEKPSFSREFGYIYTFLKISAFILFIMFTSGFYKLGDFFSNLLMKVVSVFLILITGAIIIEDVITYWLEIEIVSGLVMRSMVAGVLYIFFAISFLYLSKGKGSIYVISGVFGLLTGISFLTVILAIPGLFLLTIFEIALIILLHQEYKKKHSDTSWSVLSKESYI
jgi:transcriptional regulator with XRE-family HTH domain